MTGIGRRIRHGYVWGIFRNRENYIERVKICFDVGALSRQAVMAGDL
jgi:hypothetical protein